jgi:hypothetical protein
VPATITTTVTGTSPANLFPGITLKKGESVHLDITVDSGDTGKASETKPENVQIADSSGGTLTVPVFTHRVITITVQQNGETLTAVTSDGDEIGTIVAERGAELGFVGVPRAGAVNLPLTPSPGSAAKINLNGPTVFVLPKPPIQVAVLDGNGNVDTGFNGTVTVMLDPNAPGAVLRNGAMHTTPVINGVATFGFLAVDKPGLSFTLSAKDSRNDQSSSGPFQVLDPQVSFRTAQSCHPIVRDPMTINVSGLWDPAGGPVFLSWTGSRKRAPGTGSSSGRLTRRPRDRRQPSTPWSRPSRVQRRRLPPCRPAQAADLCRGRRQSSGRGYTRVPGAPCRWRRDRGRLAHGPHC